MPIFLDRHDLTGLTASDIAEAHRKDLEVQGKYGVRFLTYWFDESNGTGFCLIDAPSRQRCGFMTKLTATWRKMSSK
jgi:hypothetical protein